MKNFFRKVGFGIGPNEEVPSDPLNWALNQLDEIPKLSWTGKIYSEKELRKHYGKWVYGDRKKLRKKYKDNNESFFLAVGYILPHLPFIQPRKYGELYNYDDLVFTEQRTQPLNSPNRSIAHDWTELRN